MHNNFVISSISGIIHFSFRMCTNGFEVGPAPKDIKLSRVFTAQVTIFRSSVKQSRTCLNFINSPDNSQYKSPNDNEQ